MEKLPNKGQGVIMTTTRKDEPDETIEVIGAGVAKYNPMKDTMDKAGVVMPDLVATGDMTVISKEEAEEKRKLDSEPFDKKSIPLPKLGEKFMCNGNEYKVIYINPGYHRFTCEPCKNVY